MSTPILHLLTDTNKSIYLKDPIEPEKGPKKAVLNTRYLFDAKIFSYLHGGKNYKLSFDIDDISNLLSFHKDSTDIEKIIISLSNYSVMVVPEMKHSGMKLVKFYQILIKFILLFVVVPKNFIVNIELDHL